MNRDQFLKTCHDLFTDYGLDYEWKTTDNGWLIYAKCFNRVVARFSTTEKLIGNVVHMDRGTASVVRKGQKLDTIPAGTSNNFLFKHLLRLSTRNERKY